MIALPLCIFALFTLFAAKAEGVEYVERYIETDPDKKRRLNAEWHTWQWFERIFGITTGVALHISYLAEPLQTLAILPFLTVSFWIVYDGILNAYKGEWFFYQSPTSTAWTEKFATLSNKITLFMITLYILLLPICFQIPTPF